MAYHSRIFWHGRIDNRQDPAKGGHGGGTVPETIHQIRECGRQCCTLQRQWGRVSPTAPGPSGSKVAKLHVPCILRIAELGVAATLRRWRRMGRKLRSSRVASCAWRDGVAVSSSWAINVERAVIAL